MNSKKDINDLDQIIHKLNGYYSLKPIGKEGSSSALWERIENKLLQQRVIRLKRWNYIGWSAAVVILMIGVWNIYNHADVEPQALISEIQIETKIGEKNSFNLKDGSKISLLPNSSMTIYASNSNTIDSVYLSGAAKFQITKREEDFLRVRTNNFNIHVLGTTFLVEDFKTKQEATTSLIEGKLAVAPIAKNSNHTLILNHGEKVMIDKSNHEYSKQEFTQDDFLKAKGVYRYKDTPLSDYIYEVEQFYGVNIDIASKLKDECFTLIIDQNKELNEVFKDLLKIGKIKTHKTKNRHYQLTK
ncbi:FecR family protein [Halosquirtibacter xylanolyticus]|uniref:FecR family protein n=1 Tax=Halosquirtibacter xylanolyticus TaxID=3374599 RepID=UPI00374A2301|nr:FecR family protein [Prolixibacteraceae bacterium]